LLRGCLDRALRLITDSSKNGRETKTSGVGSPAIDPSSKNLMSGILTPIELKSCRTFIRNFKRWELGSNDEWSAGKWLPYT
jgi:hypothetical protein